MTTPIVSFDIAGPDLEALGAFYRNVFGWQIAPDKHFPQQAHAIQPVPVISPMRGTLRNDPPQTLIYLGVPDITAAFDKIQAHGGTPVSPRLAIPGVVVLGLFTDPAGNRLGLIEMDGDQSRVP
jgi:predicted enzyme related to lactoylglutathione lyase